MRDYQPGATLRLTGHSLGGGLATYALVGVKQAAVTTFNPAQLHPALRAELLARNPAARGQITNVRVDGDLVSASGPGLLGAVHMLPYTDATGHPHHPSILDGAL